MKVVVSEIPDEGLDLSLEEAAGADEIRIISPLRLALRLEKTGEEVVATGTLSGTVGLTCSRCLKDFLKEILTPFTVVYRPASELKGDERHELKSDELETGFYKDDELDIKELLAEQMLLSIPVKPLCGDSCMGICPMCGVELNETECGCGEKSGGVRLEVLKEYFRERRK